MWWPHLYSQSLTCTSLLSHWLYKACFLCCYFFFAVTLCHSASESPTPFCLLIFMLLAPLWLSVLVAAAHAHWRVAGGLGRRSCWEGDLAFLRLPPRSMPCPSSLALGPGRWSLRHWAPLATAFLLAQLMRGSEEILEYWWPLAPARPLSSWVW